MALVSENSKDKHRNGKGVKTVAPTYKPVSRAGQTSRQALKGG